MTPATRLSDLPTGSRAVIAALPSGVAALTRLREMGVVPGTTIQLVRRAPLGDPIEISLRGSLLSLRRSEAELIEVTAPAAGPTP
jgi:ferrous iron transport protein A